MKPKTASSSGSAASASIWRASFPGVHKSSASMKARTSPVASAAARLRAAPTPEFAWRIRTSRVPKAFQNRGGPICRPVVDGDDLVRRRTLVQHRLHRLPDIRGCVPTGEKDGHAHQSSRIMRDGAERPRAGSRARRLSCGRLLGTGLRHVSDRSGWRRRCAGCSRRPRSDEDRGRDLPRGRARSACRLGRASRDRRIISAPTRNGAWPPSARLSRSSSLAPGSTSRRNAPQTTSASGCALQAWSNAALRSGGQRSSWSRNASASQRARRAPALRAAAAPARGCRIKMTSG